jgi:hypothetical protein
MVLAAEAGDKLGTGDIMAQQVHCFSVVFIQI